ncbi:hypothetical protein L1049_001119 [Liquidambar formosana]|uniref:Helicase ATP-binding domain-containing protein n=1 Tax=Liquidambar formosana TaxID=63359 RepID=A0AAP0NAX8_LIQFO
MAKSYPFNQVSAVPEYAIEMAFRDKQRGDVTLSPNASCLVMITGILRGMLYRGSEVLKEVVWVIFDEIHYMKDRERGVVWEESIIFLPPAIKMVFLSATMSNAIEFAEWICNLHKQPCHVVYTDFRPTPLQHYVFPMGGSGLYLVVDENEQFKEDNFMKLQDTFTKQKQADGNRSGNAQAGGRIAKGGSASGGSDIYKIVKRGIAVHHSGLLPIIKGLLELLFQEGLVKALFATENFDMGLNMPAKTVVFTTVKKWDGDSHRYIGSGEYIQTLPDIGKKVSKLEQEAATLDASGDAEVAEYHKLRLDIAQLEKKMMTEITRPERVLYFLNPGWLVKVREGGTDWGWGVVVNVVKKPPAGLGTLPSAFSSSRGGGYIVDTLLHCSPGSNENDSQPKPCPPHPGEKSEMHVVPVQLPLISALSKLRISIPPYLWLLEARQSTFNDLDHHQIAALASCFIPGDKSSEQIHLRTELAKPLQQLQDSARRIAEIQHECKLDVNVDEYIESTGATFAEVIQMIDIFEGSIIRSARRLDECLNQLHAAAHAVGEADLETKFVAASESLWRVVEDGVKSVSVEDGVVVVVCQEPASIHRQEKQLLASGF